MSPVALHSQRAFDIKSMTIDWVAIVLRSTQLEDIVSTFKQKLSVANKKIVGQSFILDVSVAKTPEMLDLNHILGVFKQHGILIMALCHSDNCFEAVARAHSLGFCQPRSATQSTKVSSGSAMVVRHPVRTGQQIYAKHQDLIVLNIVNAGAEVAADGHIHIYAPLRGRALAGAKGDKNARIFVQSMEAELVSIAGVYRALDKELPSSLRHQMVQVYLEKEKLVMSAISV